LPHAHRQRLPFALPVQAEVLPPRQHKHEAGEQRDGGRERGHAACDGGVDDARRDACEYGYRANQQAFIQQGGEAAFERGDGAHGVSCVWG